MTSRLTQSITGKISVVWEQEDPQMQSTRTGFIVCLFFIENKYLFVFPNGQDIRHRQQNLSECMYDMLISSQLFIDNFELNIILKSVSVS